MARAWVGQDTERKGLFAEIGFDPRLEAQAFDALSRLDLDAAQECFGRLVEQLREPASETSSRAATLLLLDVLLRVNRRVYRIHSDEQRQGRHREALLVQFAECPNLHQARRLFPALLHRFLAPLARPSRSTHPLVARAMNFIEEHYHERLSLSTIAAALHASPNYLSRLFRQDVGMTLTCYIHKVRLEHATFLLAAGERSISEVAYLVGYQNYRDFYRNFVKQKDASPRQFRRKLLSQAPRNYGRPAVER